MVSPSGLLLAVDSSAIGRAVARAREKGVGPVKVLCPFFVDWRPAPAERRGRSNVPEELFGVKVGLASELVVLPGNGCLAVWGDRE